MEHGDTFTSHVDDLHQRLADNIRRITEELGIVLTHLPDRAGVSRAHFFNVLAGRKSPTLSWLAKVAAALGVDPLELLRPVQEDLGGKS